jgi:hypothetical protein
MRKFTLFLLLATSAVPAMAAVDDDNGGRQWRHSSESSQSADRPQRAERAERIQAREQSQPQIRVQQVEREHNQQGNEERIAAMRERMQQSQQQSNEERVASMRERIHQAQQQGAEARNERLQRYQQRQIESAQQTQGGGLMPRQRQYRTIPNTSPQVVQAPTITRDGRVGTRHDSGNYTRWASNWRNDNRYDWRRHRNHHHSIFRIGFYYDPFGYSYRRFGIGSYLYPSYYQSNYWINDPWQYRLPPVYGPYRWVRYHNDALLIDTWTGEVVDVIYGFFW